MSELEGTLVELKALEASSTEGVSSSCMESDLRSSRGPESCIQGRAREPMSIEKHAFT